MAKMEKMADCNIIAWLINQNLFPSRIENLWYIDIARVPIGAVPPVALFIKNGDSMIEIEDELQIRRRKLITASQTKRTQEEIQSVLKPFKSKGVTYVFDDHEVTITRDFEALVSDPNNNKIQRRKEVTLTVSGNLFRPIEDFIHDVKWLLAQAGSIQDAQKTVTRRA